MVPVTRYAQSGDANIAYQAVGEGALDVMFLPGWISQIEQLWELPALHRFLERLGSFSRVIMFDRRGGGLSDRVLGDYSLEQDAEDALAVLEAAGSERTALLTYSLGGITGVQLAADHPDRIGALVMYASVARHSASASVYVCTAVSVSPWASCWSASVIRLVNTSASRTSSAMVMR